jgi:hypothetical protein
MQRKKKLESESAESERKKSELALLLPLPHNTGNPVLELKATRQLESKRLE